MYDYPFSGYSNLDNRSIGHRELGNFKSVISYELNPDTVKTRDVQKNS